MMVSIVPNPYRTKATVSVDVSKGLLFNVTLFDLLGRKINELANTIADQSHYEFTIGNELTTGMYLLRVKSGNQVETRKVELQK
jgi:hypothetical protein